MTKLSPITTMVRETASTERGVPIILELHSSFAFVRLKGRRATYPVDYPTMLDLGRKIAWRAASEKQKGRKVKR